MFLPSVLVRRSSWGSRHIATAQGITSYTMAAQQQTRDLTVNVDSKCVACKGLTEAMSADDVTIQRDMLIPRWEIVDQGIKLKRSYKVRNFRSALDYINRVGMLAEAEGHHPDLTVRSYNHVDVTLWTHKVGGITENDLIMAVKIDTLPIDVYVPRKKQTNDETKAIS